MVRKVRAGGKRGGGEEVERAVHRLKDVFGNVEEALIRKVLASCENDFDAAANALLSKRKTNELVGQWKDTNNEKKRRKNKTKSEGGGSRKSFFTVFVYGFPWTVPSEEIEEAMHQLLDPGAKDQVLQVRIPTKSSNNTVVNSTHGGFGFADVVAKPRNLQLATRLERSSQAGELLLFNTQVRLEVQSKGKGGEEEYSLDLISDLEAVDVNSRRFGRGTRPGFSDGGNGMSLDEREEGEEEEENRPQKQKGKNKKKKNAKLGGGGGAKDECDDDEADLVDAFNETLKRKAELKLELVELEQREQELREKIRSELVVLQRRCERMSMVSTKINPSMNVGGGSAATMLQGTSAFPYSVSNSPPSTPELPSPPSMQNASTLCWSSRVKLT